MLKAALTAHGYEVAEAAYGKDGISFASSFHPHLIILDLGLPDMPGDQVLEKLRTWTEIPVIVLTVTDDEDSKVSLLDKGADDYLTKPFGLQELLARIRVGLRHKDLIEATPTFSSGELFIDLNGHKVIVNGVPAKLTTTEYELLSQLVRSRGRVVSQSYLLKAVWGPNAEDQGHYLRIYIGQLRKKLEADPSSPKHIITEPGVGYRIV
jgi:two-component system KDP operon response regulator KdpE